MDVSIVLPVFNERENLEPLLGEIELAMRATSRTWEVVIVDDGSTDDSTALIRRLAREKPYLRAILFRRNSGQTAAFDAGFRAVRGRIVVTMDSDRQNDPADVPKMIEKLESGGYDFVTGWRRHRKDGFLLRKVPSRIANRLIRYLTGSQVHDLGCSLKVYRKEITDELRLYGEMHRFISIHVESLGAKVGEFEVNHRPRVAGTSKYGLSRTLKVPLDLMTVWFLHGYRTKPIYVFGSVGALLLGTGGLSALFVLYEKYELGVWVHRNPLFILAVMSAVIGIQFISLGLIAEIIIRTYFESQNKVAYSVAERVGGVEPRPAHPCAESRDS